MRITHLLPLVAGASVVLAGGPGGPSNIPSAPAGPDKLELCGCGPIYKKMVECQPVKGVNENIRDCVCIENGEPGAWYGYLLNCRACLGSDNEDDKADEFFGNVGSTMSQLMVSCTNVGGGVVSDGKSICASNAMFEACAGLYEGRDSWASFEENGEISNATFFLNIDAPNQQDDVTESSTSLSALPSSTPAPSGSSKPTTGTGTTPTGEAGTGTSSSPTSTSTQTSGAILSIIPESRFGGLVALAAAFSAGSAWL